MGSGHELKWQEINDLPEDWKDSLTVPETSALVKVWQEQSEELREKELFEQFHDRLRRQWAVETGVIEGIYDITEAGTNTLIERGLDASYLAHDETNQSPIDVVTKIQDHYDTLMGLYQFVKGERPLGTSYVKELHVALTAHQSTYDAIDTLGNFVPREMPHGIWKKLANNVKHSDGTTFEYCPPEHVDMEMERLISFHLEHVKMGVPTDVEAAWIHHRFTLIHPFTDGNGRVARCLATLVLLKDFWFPFVVTRKDRSDYIDAIRQADKGVLKPFIELIGTLQRRAVREALSISEELITEAKAVKSILSAVKEKFGNERERKRREIESSFEVANSLHELTRTRIGSLETEITEAIASEGYRCFSDSALQGAEHDYYFHKQTVDCAKKLGYFADRRRYQSWVKLAIVTNHRTEILLTFHGVGHNNSGILGCAAMAFTRDKSGNPEESDGSFSDVTPLSSEPFEFVYSEDGTDVQKRFRRWLDQVIIEGLNYWQKTI